MYISQTCEHAIRALIYLAQNSARTFISIKEISTKLNISFFYLTKIFQQLQQKKITISSKGKNGGVALNPERDEIFLIQIIRAVDENKIIQRCFLGFTHSKELISPFCDLCYFNCKDVIHDFNTISLQDLVIKINNLNMSQNQNRSFGI